MSFFWVCLSVCKKIQFFLIPFWGGGGKNTDRYSVTGTDYRRNCGRAYNGWPIANRPTTDYNGAGTKYTLKALKTFAKFARCECGPKTTPISRALFYLSDTVNNVMFVSIV